MAAAISSVTVCEQCVINCMEQWPSQDGLVCEINPFQEIRIKTAFTSIFSQEEKKNLSSKDQSKVPCFKNRSTW